MLREIVNILFKNFVNNLKNYLIPSISVDVQEDVDREGMRNISHISLFTLLFVVILLVMAVMNLLQASDERRRAQSRGVFGKKGA